MDEWVDGWVAGRMDGQTERLTGTKPFDSCHIYHLEHVSFIAAVIPTSVPYPVQSLSPVIKKAMAAD